jgi:hypothetical protein
MSSPRAFGAVSSTGSLAAIAPGSAALVVPSLFSDQPFGATAGHSFPDKLQSRPAKMTVEKLGYIVAAVGVALVVYALHDGWVITVQAGLYSGVAIFLVGVGLVAFDLNKRR